jgi:hypothetical protein
MRPRGPAALAAVVALAGASLVTIAATPADAQTQTVVFEDVECQAQVGSGTITQSQDIEVTISAPDSVAPNSSFTVTFPGGTSELPTRASGLAITAYRDILLTYQINGTTFTAGSIVNPGTAHLVRSNATEADIVQSATLPQPDRFGTGQPGPFSPGPGPGPATLTTPTITVDAVAPASGEVTLNALTLTTGVTLNGSINTTATCDIPTSTIITIPVSGGPTNTPPSVDAGADVEGDVGEAIAVDGTVTDAEDTPTTEWTIDSPDCSFADASAVDTTVTCTVAGVYTATLTADDGTNPPVSDTATVTVNEVVAGCTGLCASIGDAFVYEDGIASLAVTLSQPAPADMTIAATIGGGDATNGFGLPKGSAMDFKLKPTKTVTIRAGKYKGFVNVKTLPDALVEADETFNVTLSNPSAGDIGRAVGTATIHDATEIPAGQLLIGDSLIVRSSVGTKITAKVPVVLSEAAATDVSVTYSTSSSTLVGAKTGDYLPKISKTLLFKPGQVRKFVTVVILGSNSQSGPATIDFTFSDPSGAALDNGNTGTATVLPTPPTGG